MTAIEPHTIPFEAVTDCFGAKRIHITRIRRYQDGRPIIVDGAPATVTTLIGYTREAGQ